MESPGPLLAGTREKAGPGARPVTGLGKQLAASGHLLDEQTLSVGLEIPSQQMDLDREIQMQGHGLAPTTDTSVGRRQGALVAEDGDDTGLEEAEVTSKEVMLYPKIDTNNG